MEMHPVRTSQLLRRRSQLLQPRQVATTQSSGEMTTGEKTETPMGMATSRIYSTTHWSVPPTKIKGPLGLLPQRPLRLRTFENQLPLTIVHRSPKIPKIFLA